jgi:hypothetical protein
VYGVYVKHHKNESRQGRVFPPLRPDDSLFDKACVGCQEQLGNGNPVVLLIVGPGNDDEEWERCRAGHWYTAEAIPVHAICAGVDTEGLDL